MIASRLALLLGVGAAEPPGLELQWDAPPACPDRAQLLATIDATLGEVGEGEQRPVRVRGRVRSEPDAGFVVRLELDDGRAGTRELRDASCEGLTEAAALVIAMTIDPRLLEHQAANEAELEPSTESPAVAVPSSEPAATSSSPALAISPSEPTASSSASAPALAEPPRPELEPLPVPRPSLRRPGLDRDRSGDDAHSRSRRRVRLHALGRAHAGIGIGPLPGVTTVLGLAAGVGGRGWRTEVSASYWAPRMRASATNPSVGVWAQLWAVGVHGCGEPSWRSLSFPLCAGVLAGAVHARGVGALEPRTVASRWVAAALEPGLVWWTRPRFGVAARAEGHVALARPDLRAEPSGTVFQSISAGVTVRVGVELRLP